MKEYFVKFYLSGCSEGILVVVFKVGIWLGIS